MHKIWAILLLFSFVFGDASHVNVLRIQGMWDHYKFHKKENKDLGFMAFLKMHYKDEHGYANDQKAHNNLPFKSKHETGSTGLPCYVVPDNFVSVTCNVYPVLRPQNPDYQAFLQRGFPISLFRPPSFS